MKKTEFNNHLKNRIMKTILTALIILMSFVNQQINAQNKILKINFGEDENQWMMYPPNTKFNLIDNNLITVFSEKDDYGVFDISKKYRLEIFPKYKSDSDVYILEKGSIEIIEKDYVVHKKKEKKTIQKIEHSKVIAATKTITDSKVKKGRKNLILKFTNGIEFTYTDGKIGATLNGKDIYVEGKYLVYSKLGVAKISFNPKNGETWWVFEEKK